MSSPGSSPRSERRFRKPEGGDAEEAPPEPELHLFYSFDLVNSTRYKTLEPDRWPDVIRSFYSVVVETMLPVNSTMCGPPVVWKFVGDEVLFSQQIRSRSDLFRSLDAARTVLRETVRALRGETVESRHVLDVKAAVWCAAVVEEVPGRRISRGPRNLRTHPDPARRRQVDFIGPDIDAGFRVAKECEPSRLVVSAALARLLCGIARSADERKTCRGLRIVALRKLKGVWDELHYPILWYEKDWSRIVASFRYDQFEISSIARSLRDSPGALGSPGNALEKIYEEAGQEEREMPFLLELARALPARCERIEGRVPVHPEAEIHCVAICVDSRNRVLVRKRGARKQVLPGIHDFGCAQLEAGCGFAETLREEYREDYGVEIGLLGDPPVPLGSYEFEVHGQRVPGVIFPAFGRGASPRAKAGDRARWLTLDEIDRLEDTACVPEFKRNAREAVARVGDSRGRVGS